MARIPLPGFLRPAWIDEGRRLVQEPALRRALADTPLRGALLNAGCGEGMYAPLLESFAGLQQIVHVDLHRPTFGAARADRRNCFAAASVTALPFAAGTFDAVMCSEVIEHVVDDRTAVRELARVLRPSGWLLLSVPTPPAPPDPGHVREGYTLAELQRLLEPHGFTVRRHVFALHWFMRLAYATWKWQYLSIGRGRRSFFPRGLVRLLAALDRRWPVGKPWDVIVLAQRLHYEGAHPDRR